MLVTAAVCPHPPLLVPAVAGGAAPELDGLRAACDKAVRRLTAADAETLVVVGSGTRTRAYGPGAAGSLRPYGVDVRVGAGGGDDGEGEDALPLSLTIGVWLLERVGWPGVPELHEVGFDTPPEECLRLGERLARRADRVAFLVMGDSSACRDERAPGYVDPRSRSFDATVARALAEGDPATLAGLDPRLAGELLVAGRPAWQVLAGAADGARFSAELLADDAPYGVCYLVATWTRRG